MTKSEIINAIINGLTAIGTIIVAILAIWGDFFRAQFAGPKLSLVPHNLRGSVVPITNGRRSIFYHLKVVNARNWVRATNCRVLLKKLWRRVPNGAFQEVTLTVPLTFVWAPSEITPPYVTLVKEHVLDFGFVRANEVVRFGLEIVSDNFISPRLQTFEVAWNGQWNDNLDVMAQNLQIQEVADQIPAA